MASLWRCAAAVSLALALCCIVTLNSNEEIKVEAEEDHFGMAHDRDAEDEDSDDLSPGEKALIAAADGKEEDDKEVQTMKFSELPAAQNGADQKRKGKEEDAEDELSPAEKALIAAANTAGKKKPRKTASVSKAPVITTKASSAVELSGVKRAVHSKQSQDELSPEERALITAANHGRKKAVHAKIRKVKQPKKLKRKVVSHAKAFHHKQVDNFASEERKLREDSDELTPEEEKLIHAAGPSHEQQQVLKKPVVMSSRKSSTMIATAIPKAQTAPSQKDMMKRAMEKITKAAAQQAVAAQTEGLVHFDNKKVHTPAAPPTEAVETSAPIKTSAQIKPAAVDARSVVFGHATAVPSATTKMANILKPQGKIKIKPVPHKSWEQQLAEADRRARQMAMADSGALTPQQIQAANDMEKHLREEQSHGVMFHDTLPTVDPRVMDAVMGVPSA